MGIRVRCQVKVVDDVQVVEEIHKIVVHQFTMSDVEDIDIYVAEPIWKWQQTDAGRFVMKNAVSEPEWHQQLDHNIMGYRIAITAELEKKKLSEFYLRWGTPKWK